MIHIYDTCPLAAIKRVTSELTDWHLTFDWDRGLGGQRPPDHGHPIDMTIFVYNNVVLASGAKLPASRRSELCEEFEDCSLPFDERWAEQKSALDAPTAVSAATTNHADPAYLWRILKAA
jgi:hypothetical protein